MYDLLQNNFVGEHLLPLLPHVPAFMGVGFSQLTWGERGIRHCTSPLASGLPRRHSDDCVVV